MSEVLLNCRHSLKTIFTSSLVTFRAYAGETTSDSIRHRLIGSMGNEMPYLHYVLQVKLDPPTLQDICLDLAPFWMKV